MGESDPFTLEHEVAESCVQLRFAFLALRDDPHMGTQRVWLERYLMWQTAVDALIADRQEREKRHDRG